MRTKQRGEAATPSYRCLPYTCSQNHTRPYFDRTQCSHSETFHHMSKRKFGVDVTKDMLAEFKCIDLIESQLMTLKGGWVRDRHWNVFCTFKRIVIAIKHMDEPEPSTFHSWYETAFGGKTDVQSCCTAKLVNAVVGGNKAKYHGWNDLFGGFCLVNSMFEGGEFKKVVASAIAAEASDTQNNTRIAQLDEIEKILTDDLQIRCMQTFFKAILDKDPKLSLQMKHALLYPLGAQTKEEKIHQEAISMLRSQKEEDDF